MLTPTHQPPQQLYSPNNPPCFRLHVHLHPFLPPFFPPLLLLLPGEEPRKGELDSLQAPLNERTAIAFRFEGGGGGGGGREGGRGGGDAVMELDEEGGSDG